MYVGDARGEKGFQHLPGIVAALADAAVRFTIQCYLPAIGHEPEIVAARDALAAFPPDRVTLVPEVLSPGEYRSLIGAADIVLVPYDADIYYARSSGIFVEAIVAGCPVVAPAGSWMGREIEAIAGKVGRTFDTADEIPRCVREILGDYAEYRSDCLEASPVWAARHSPSALVEALCERARIMPANTPGPEHLPTLPVVILAGGLGTRLREAIPDLPKALAPIGQRSFLSILIEMLAKKGARSFVLCVGYRSEQIRDELGDGSELGVEIAYSTETETLLGTAGALKLAERFFAPRAIVMNGDTYFDIDYESFCAEHLARVAGEGVLATIAVSRVDDASRFGTIESDPETDRVLAFREKEAGTGAGWVNGGVYLLERAVLDLVPPATKCSIEREVLPRAVADHALVFAHRSRTPFFDIGTPASLQAFADFYAKP